MPWATDGWSDELAAAVDDLGEGGVSEVFADEVYTLPSYSEGYEFSELPDELGEYFRDCMSEILWEEDCNSYLLELYESVEVVMYSMPSGLSYDVEM